MAAISTDKAAHAIASKGPGSPMNPATRETLESRMGADFSNARVHADAVANEGARALNARAFTQGKDIYMATGESENDLRLMAHESTHVIQQGAASANPAARMLQPVSQHRTDENEPIQRQATAAKDAEAKPTGNTDEDVAPGVVDLKGQPSFPASPQLDEYLEGRKKKTGNV